MKIYKLIAVLILLPLGLNLIGAWQLQRSVENTERLTEIQADLAHARPYFERLARSPDALTRTMDMDGENITLKEALSRLHEAEQGLDFVVALGSVTTWLARAVIALCLLAALVGGIGLAGLNWAGARARQSRERLLHTSAGSGEFCPSSWWGTSSPWARRCRQSSVSKPWACGMWGACPQANSS